MRQGGEQFSVLVPASFPTEPFAPKPLRVMLMALRGAHVVHIRLGCTGARHRQGIRAWRRRHARELGDQEQAG